MPLSPRRNHRLPHAGEELLRQLRVVDGAREEKRADHRAEGDDGVLPAAEHVLQAREVALDARTELRADALVAARRVRSQAGDRADSFERDQAWVSTVIKSRRMPW